MLKQHWISWPLKKGRNKHQIAKTQCFSSRVGMVGLKQLQATNIVPDNIIMWYSNVKWTV